MSSKELSERKRQEIEEIARGWGKLRPGSEQGNTLWRLAMSSWRMHQRSKGSPSTT